MSFGLFLIVGVVVAGVVLLQRSGGAGISGAFATLLNGSQSKFSRKEDDVTGSTAFHITPARASWAILGICIALYFVGKWISDADAARGTSSIIPYLFWVFIPVFGYFFLIGSRHRKPVQLVVTDQALQAGPNSWPLSDVAQLHIRKASRRGEEELSPIVTNTAAGYVSGGVPTSALIGKALGGRMAQRSYLLTLRTTQGSKEHILAGGMTQECAMALLHDLSQRLQRNPIPQ